jgi:hypothetical protein
VITASAVAKYTPPIVATAAVIDLQLAGGIAFGFASGWAARAAVQVSARESSAAILRDFLVSVLISGGSLLLVLFSVEAFDLTPLGAAVLSFILAMGGVKLIEKIHHEATDWLRRKLTDVDAVQAEKRQEAQKMIAAIRQAKKDESDD